MAPKFKKLPSGVSVGRDLLWGGWSTCAVAAALQLDVFTTIAAGKPTTQEIAAEARANPGMMRRLLDTLVALKYLGRKSDRYSLTPHAATYLVRGSELYMEGADEFATGQMMTWFHLADVIRTGAPNLHSGGEAGRGDFFAMLVKVIFPPNYVAAKAAIASIPAAGRSRIRNVLDVAAGAAAFSIPFAQANKNTRVTVVDLPQVTRVTREYAARFAVAGQYEYREGDLHEVDFGSASYDLVTLGHIIHAVGRDAGRELIQRSAQALRERGILLIAELVPNDDRTGPPLAMLFGLNMMINTPAGDVFTMKEYRGWLKEAGFKTVKAIRSPSAPSPLILATR